jgi:hypothetical protein
MAPPYPDLHACALFPLAPQDQIGKKKFQLSCTTGRAGGLNSEPLKAVENLGPPKVAAYSNNFN